MRRARGPSQLGELSTRWRLHQTEAQRAGGTLDVHSVEEKHVEVDVEVERTAEALDQCGRAGAYRLAREPGLLDQVGTSSDTR